MELFRIVLTGVVLTALLGFRFKADKSRFEIDRLAEHSAKYKTLVKFLDIYSGLTALAWFLALVDAILLVMFAAFSWGIFTGGGVALAVLLSAFLLARLLRRTTQRLIGKHLNFFNKYFSWTKILGRLATAHDELRVESEAELVHLIEQGDFLDDQTKMLLKNVLSLRDQTVKEVITPRDQVAFLHLKDRLTPKLLDELFASGHKVFPVAGGDLDHIVGLLYLDDVLPVEQEEKDLGKVMRKCPPSVDQEAPLESALNQMCEYHSTILLASKNDDIVGVVTLRDLMRVLFKPEE